jgi:putrescine aminotransferase
MSTNHSTPEPDSSTITDDVIEKYQKYVNPTQVALLRIAGFDHIEHSANGTRITDLEGNSYIDCLGGYGVFSLGHRHPKVVEAVKRQLDLMPLSSKTFLNKPLADLSERLAAISPEGLQYTFVCNSGAEAVEGALKVARMATGRHGIVACAEGFHGKTMGALSTTGRELYRKPFTPLIPEVVHVPWNDIHSAAEAVTESTAAFIVEPIQGEGGIRVPSDDYLPELRKICDRAGALLIVDEIQTGLGRTGKMFAVDHWGVRPDIMTLAKSLGGGVMPIGAFMATTEIWDKVFRENPFIHTSTFGGNELACVAGLAAIDAIITEGLADKAAKQGDYFLSRLKELRSRHSEIFVDVRGKGLMLGVEVSDPDIAKIIIGALVHEGVIVAYTLNNPNVLRIEPPLIISRDEIEIVLKALEAGATQAQELLALLD